MFKNGATLRFPIRDAQGLLLMPQGTVVTDRLHRLLTIRGISIELQATLKCVKGDRPGLEIPINKANFKIGRRPDCDLQLASQVVSGYHCEIQKRPDVVILADLKSNNGTFLNRQRLTENAEMKDGDALRVGNFLFTIEICAALAADSPAGAQALNAWILEEKSPKGRRATPYCPTENDIDLDAACQPSAPRGAPSS